MGSMIKKVAYRFHEIVSTRDTDLVELMLAVVYLGISGVFFNQDEPVFSRNPLSYRILALISPEGVWGVLIGLIGVMLAVGVILEVMSLRIVGTMLAVMVWALFAASFYLSGRAPIGFWTYTSFAVVSAIVLRKLTKYGD